MTMNATVLQPGGGQAIWQLGNRFTLKAVGEETQGRFAILEQFFAEVERQFPEANGMPAPEQVGPALNALANEYVLQIVGPPPQ